MSQKIWGQEFFEDYVLGHFKNTFWPYPMSSNVPSDLEKDKTGQCQLRNSMLGIPKQAQSKVSK